MTLETLVEYETVSGDTYASIAEAHGMDVEVLRTVNPGLTGNITPGTVVRVTEPTTDENAAISDDALGDVSEPHYCTDGETLADLAAQYGLSADVIYEFGDNASTIGSDRDAKLFTGQRLDIP